jgi:rod shape-determining protein MreC
LLERLVRYERLERSAAEISQENIRLREQLAFSQSLMYRHIPAELIGRDPDNLYSALVINKGRRAGIRKDMGVVAWQGGSQALVGKVIQVSAFESLVMPLYDTSLLVASRFAASRFEGIVEGQGNPDSPLRMRYIPKRARDEIGKGDLIVSSGMGGIYPPGINIGRVNSVAYYEHEISMEAEVEPLIDFSRLEYVFVIEKKIIEDDEDQEYSYWRDVLSFGDENGKKNCLDCCIWNCCGDTSVNPAFPPCALPGSTGHRPGYHCLFRLCQRRDDRPAFRFFLRDSPGFNIRLPLWP